MPIDFRVRGLQTPLRVARFEGSEGISELFDVELTLIGDAKYAVEIDDALGREACLTVAGLHGPRHLHGVLARFEQADVDRHSIVYSATLSPRVHRLLHRYDCRIFQPKAGQSLSVGQILELVLMGAGLSADKDYRLSLSNMYTPRDACAQYRESDWAFCCRLMEEEGIFYFFEHEQDGHVLVIADAPAVHADIPEGSVRFREPRGAQRGGEDVTRFRYAGQVRPEAITLRDYNFEKPMDPLESSAGAEADGSLSIYDYPGAYASGAAGDRRAKIRLEEQQALSKQGRGESRSSRLVPGQVFELQEHPRHAMNKRYLVTRVEHSGFEPVLVAAEKGEQEPSYENRFQCIPAGVPFRPPRLTPRPVIQGMQTAVVVCPSGEEVETDSHGRVQVRFHWERGRSGEAKQEESSCWVRVGQVWAGAGFGAMFIPRRGQEVLVSFLEGDPDRPVIVGSLYHATNVVPYPLPGGKTQSGIRSNSSPGGESGNELRFEDKKGGEALYLHAQKDMTVRVEHDEALEVKNERRVEVGANERLSIGGERVTELKGNETEKVGGEKKSEVGKSFTEEIEGDLSLAVGGDRGEHVMGESRVLVDGTYKLTVKGMTLELACGSVKLKIGPLGVAIEGGMLTVNGHPPMLL